MTCLRCHQGAENYYRVQHENGDHGGFVCPACADELKERYESNGWDGCVLGNDCENERVYSIVRTTPPEHPTAGSAGPWGSDNGFLENVLCESHCPGC